MYKLREMRERLKKKEKKKSREKKRETEEKRILYFKIKKMYKKKNGKRTL